MNLLDAVQQGGGLPVVDLVELLLESLSPAPPVEGENEQRENTVKE